MQRFWKYLFNWIHLFDQSVNTLLGGDPRMTLSARMGRDIGLGKCKTCSIVCKFLNIFQSDHCIKAWESELIAPNPRDQVVDE